jgi:nucleotide-binding universal stress UspA family protein
MRILLAIDGSAASAVAAHMIPTRPWPKQSSLRLLTVVQPISVAFGPLGGQPQSTDLLDRLAREEMEWANALLKEAAISMRDSGLPVETAVRMGDPRAEIVADAQEHGADLVILGSHGRTGLKRWFLGSVAEHVVRHAPCSVEVVRRPEEAPPPSGGVR